MTGKERAVLKKAFNEAFSDAEANIVLSQLGEVSDANSSENKESTAETRQIVIDGLKGNKETLRQLLAQYEKAIDDAIAKMS